MKNIIISLTVTAVLLFLSGCYSITGYTVEDLVNDRRQDLVGYMFNLKGHSTTSYSDFNVEPKPYISNMKGEIVSNPMWFYYHKD